VFLALSVLLAALAVVLALLPQGPLPLALGLCGVWAFGWHLGWQMSRLDTTDPARCLHLFRSNRDAGLILALFLAGAALV
jgi:4-hydroxybenzoate polyprenyltransferase